MCWRVFCHALFTIKWWWWWWCYYRNVWLHVSNEATAASHLLPKPCVRAAVVVQITQRTDCSRTSALSDHIATPKQPFTRLHLTVTIARMHRTSTAIQSINPFNRPLSRIFQKIRLAEPYFRLISGSYGIRLKIRPNTTNSASKTDKFRQSNSKYRQPIEGVWSFYTCTLDLHRKDLRSTNRCL